MEGILIVMLGMMSLFAIIVIILVSLVSLVIGLLLSFCGIPLIYKLRGVPRDKRRIGWNHKIVLSIPLAMVTGIFIIVGGFLFMTYGDTFLSSPQDIFEDATDLALPPDKSIDIPGLKDTVTAETNLMITPKTIYEGLKFERAHENFGDIRKALGSFRELTESLDKSLYNERKKKIGYMAWETQNLGLPNGSNYVEGVLMKQDYLIKKMEYELAKQRSESGRRVNANDLSNLKAKYLSSEKRLVDYLNAYTYAD
jgi:hypothetical protein